MSRPDVVVTGLGALTPVGATARESWQGVLAGRCGGSAVQADWAADLPVRICAPVCTEPAALLEPGRARTLDRSEQLALLAAREAWSDAGSPAVNPERLAVVVASGIGGLQTLLGQYDILRESGARRLSPFAVPMLMANGPAATVALELQARAGVHAPVSACASGAEAVAQAIDILRAGRADVVVCGGAEAAIHRFTLAAFAAMRALSRRNDEPQAASRPFDKSRDGFVLGEGAGILVLELEEHARARGARVYARACGAGISSDAHHVAAPDPQGAGAERAIRAALDDAGLQAGDIRHVNAHATSTPAGDVAEAAALERVLAAHPGEVVVSSTKGSTGHLLGAAGAVEAILTVLAVHERLAPPTTNLDDPDDEVRLDLARVRPRPLPAASAALSNSFGFGGHNVALVFQAVA